MGAVQLVNFIEVNEAIKCFCLSKEPLGRKQVFLAKNMALQNRFARNLAKFLIDLVLYASFFCEIN